MQSNALKHEMFTKGLCMQIEISLQNFRKLMSINQSSSSFILSLHYEILGKYKAYYYKLPIYYTPSW